MQDGAARPTRGVHEQAGFDDLGELLAGLCAFFKNERPGWLEEALPEHVTRENFHRATTGMSTVQHKRLPRPRSCPGHCCVFNMRYRGGCDVSRYRCCAHVCRPHRDRYTPCGSPLFAPSVLQIIPRQLTSQNKASEYGNAARKFASYNRWANLRRRRLRCVAKVKKKHAVSATRGHIGQNVKSRIARH